VSDVDGVLSRLGTRIDFDAVEARASYERSVDPRHPDHWIGAEVHDEGGVTLWWGGYEYTWGYVTKTPAAALYLVTHVAKKNWPGMTGKRISRLIEEIGRVHGWNPWEPTLPRRGTSADEERAKLTPSLRWRVLKRDGHRCRSCGAGPEHGAVLHIDHVVAIVNGGATAFENLQTLCASCNYGKRTG
jgi:5-methylcytosine-specific restriction endonuclease McrA